MRILITGLCVLMPLLAQASMYDEVFEAERECSATATTFEERRDCLVRATPRKCRSHVRGKTGQLQSIPMRETWLKCVSTCEGADFFSRTFGGCSTPSDPRK